MAGSTAERVRAAVARFLGRVGFPRGALLLAAVSGGQDSVCLLDAVGAALVELGGRLLVVHVDHGLRGAESTDDATAVDQLAAQFGYPSLIITVDVAGYARRHSLGLEEAGRNLRYQALGATAAEQGAWAAVTGHTADDLAETLLINILRGTGPLGTTGIPTNQIYSGHRLGPPGLEADAVWAGMPLRVLRPLLDVTREETERYCREQGLPFRLDRTNVDPRFTRNRIRHHLLPLLRSYNPSIVAALGRLARLAADDEAELERTIEDLWQARASASGSRVVFSWAGWLALGPAVQRRLLWRAWGELSGGRGRSFQSLEAARLLLASQTPGRRLALGGGIELRTSRRGFDLRSGVR